MQRVLTGLQPTGEIHLGNFIGSIMQMVKLQVNYESYIFIADLHALTVPRDPFELHQKIRSLVALYIACGLDPDKNTIYIQSENKYIANISWMLECTTYFGELSRMTQFKDKSLKNENFTVGLLTYPVLMAADILAMKSDLVPVGQDQKQHVEIARDIAIRFNKKYKDLFVIPEPLITEVGTKIMDLQNPDKKMSKSDENQKGCIRMLDDPELIRKKIMSATTDSGKAILFDPINKQGISNLINIYSALSDMKIRDIEEKFKAANYGEFKTAVADLVVSVISKIQDKYYNIIDSQELDEILDRGAKKSKEESKETYKQMKIAMGLYR